MNNRRLLWQLYPANLLITLVAVLLISWFGSSSVRDFYFDEMEHGLESRARLIEQHITRLLVKSPDELQKYCKQAGRNSATRLTVVQTDGLVLADSSEDPAIMSNHSNRPELSNALNGKFGSSLRFSKTLGENMLYIAIPLFDNSNNIIGALRLSVATTPLNAVLRSINAKVVIGGFFVVIAAAYFTLLAARKITRPLEKIKQEAEKMAFDEMEGRVIIDPGKTSAEVYSLAASLNNMSKRIDERMRTITLQRNELEAVFSSMNEMVVAIDSNKRIIRINRAAAALFYLSPDDVQGKLLHDVIRNREIHDIVDNVFDQGERLEKNIRIYIGPERLHLHTSAVPLLGEENNPIGVLVVMNDMTRMHKLENLRRDFVANVSHELKTPITSIQGYVETLLDGAVEDKEDARRFLKIIAKQSFRLDAIIDDLLLLSRVEQQTDHDDISLTPTTLCPIIESSVLTCRQQADDKKIQFEIHCSDNLIAAVNNNLIEQAIMNLLKNAVMYSPEKSKIYVQAYKSQSPQNDRIIIAVKDQGIGIATEHQDRLFERFYRCDKGRSKEQGGTGLGLSIVKHIAMAHGGSVSVESQPGQGSTFSISIPQAINI